VQYSLCVQVLLSPILAALLHGTRAVVISQTFSMVSSRDRAVIPFDIGVELSSYVKFWPIFIIFNKKMLYEEDAVLLHWVAGNQLVRDVMGRHSYIYDVFA